MKNNLLLLSLSLWFLGCTQEQSSTNLSESKSDIPTDFIKTFEGQIGGKHDIVMKITANDANITGGYYYKKHQSELQLKGEIKNDSIFLQEFNDNKDLTGIFRAKLVNENKIEGIWSKLDGSKATELLLLASNTTYTPKKLKEKKPKINIAGEWIGEKPPNYTTPDGTFDGHPASMSVNYIGANRYKFIITQGTPNHMSCLEPSGIGGKFELKGNKAKGVDLYWSYDEDKQLEGYIIFEFSKDKVEIKYEPYHVDDIGCYFPYILKR